VNNLGYLQDLVSTYPNDEDLGRNLRKHIWIIFELRSKRIHKVEKLLKLLSKKTK